MDIRLSGSADEPLLLSAKDVETGHAKQKPVFVTLIKWVLKFIMWVIFISWVTFIFLYPAEFAQRFCQSLIHSTRGTIFGITGSIFLIFSVPVLILVFLSIAYLIVSPSEDFLEKKNLRDLRFRLWTFPILVDGPFGVVSVAEFIGIIFVIIYILWAVSAYTLQNFDLVSKLELPMRKESILILELSGLRFGTIGLFCLAFLFLPITRGSFLLRLIDLPFEHATRYHVWLGNLTMLLFTLHGIFYIVAWSMQGRLLQEILQWQDIGVANLPGVISLCAGLLLWVTTLYPVRKQYFELFFYTHQLYVVFIVFLVLHVGDFIFSIAAGGIFLFLVDRFLRFCQSRKTVNIISATCLPCGTVKLILPKPKNLRYNALSFIFLQVHQLSWLQWHPFSVSSSPLDGRHHLSVLIKVLGGWTKSLRDTISKDPEKQPLKQLAVTASVEGPYGHELAYYLMYENLILVAGGIGISPFLAILSDIFHRIEERKPCLPKRILVVWAMKKSAELSLLSSVDLLSMCPSFSNKLHLEIEVYVTQELEPPLEDGIVCNSMDYSNFPVTNGCNMSGLVGTGNNIWSGIYVLASTIGFITFLALMDLFYIKPFGITTWWFKGLLFVACMIAGVIIFGGLVVILWHLWERRNSDSDNEKYIQEDKNCDSELLTNQMTHPSANQTALASLIMTQYGVRPEFQEIFHRISESWDEVDDVGVIVCGPPTLQSSVAKACKSHNIMGRQKNHQQQQQQQQQQPFFHFNRHTFDL